MANYDYFFLNWSVNGQMFLCVCVCESYACTTQCSIHIVCITHR